MTVAVMNGAFEPLTYRVPPALEVWPGQRVLVPLAARRATGIVVEPERRPAPGHNIRTILRVLDAEPLLSPELLTLGLWIAEYYHAPVGEVFRAMLPVGKETRRVKVVSLTEAGRARESELASSLLTEVRESDEARFLSHLALRPHLSLSAARSQPGGAALIAEGIKRRWIEVGDEQRDRRKVMAVTLAGVSFVPALGRRLPRAAQRIIEALEERGPSRDHRELVKTAKASLAMLRQLEAEGIVNCADARTALLGPPTPGGDGAASELSVDTVALALTTGQSSALESLEAQLCRNEFGVSLLHGVTGSGKTEVYLRLMAKCLESGRSALLLVPEISLTPAARAIFAERFGKQVALLHSGLGAAERQAEWWRIWRGEARAVLGTRSAVFAPLANLGLIVVDEEHDASYKQQDTPRYHGRDVAVVRARLAGALAVLGSATPSLESYSNAQQGKYRLLTLAQRVLNRPLAQVEIVDMREEFRETRTQALLSRRLREEIEKQLASGNQTMILLNHRGYSWFVLCRSCGEAVTCANCSISLTYHRREHRLICHYCGATAAVPSRCAACGSEYLHYVGEGTEKIEDKLRELFPRARVARLDRDVAKAGRFARVLAAFRDGETDILVGTQLIAKGHDFPGVTLVGIVSADMGLRLPDFRAAERTFQLLTQAAGRAGRGEAPGRVLVQTFYPGHYSIRLAADQNYAGFFSKEMGFRRLMHYPPAAALANVIAQDEDLEKAAGIAQMLDECLRSAADPRYILKLGPNPAPLARIERRYRIQILLKASSRAQLNRTINELIVECRRRRIPPRSVLIDVDPVNIM